MKTDASEALQDAQLEQWASSTEKDKFIKTSFPTCVLFLLLIGECSEIALLFSLTFAYIISKTKPFNLRGKGMSD